MYNNDYYFDWENSEGYLVYKILFYPCADEFTEYKPFACYIGSCRSKSAKKRWKQGLTIGSSRSYNKRVMQALEESWKCEIVPVAYNMTREQARILEYTLINHNPNALNYIRKPDCEMVVKV